MSSSTKTCNISTSKKVTVVMVTIEIAPLRCSAFDLVFHQCLYNK